MSSLITYLVKVPVYLILGTDFAGRTTNGLTRLALEVYHHFRAKHFRSRHFLHGYPFLELFLLRHSIFLGHCFVFIINIFIYFHLYIKEYILTENDTIALNYELYKL